MTTVDYVVTPFKPRPKLFLALFLIFALWVAGMLWMYFATVYPQRHAKPAVSKTTPLQELPLR